MKEIPETDDLMLFWSPIFFGKYKEIKQLKHDIESILPKDLRIVYQKLWTDKPEIYPKRR